MARHKVIGNGGFSVKLPHSLATIEKCVFKLFYGDAYIIMMGKTLQRQVEIIIQDVEKYKRGKWSRGDMYLSFYQHIVKNPNLYFEVELLLEDESPYQLLKRCQYELDEGAGDHDCFNLNTEPYLSRFIQTPPIYLTQKRRAYKYWINRGYYLNFRKWQYNRHLSAIK